MATMDMQATPALTQKDMPYVAFEARTEEDAKASKKEGRMVWKDQHYARITPPGSRDVHYEQLPEWWGKLHYEAKGGRILPEWIDRWQSAYEKWAKGQEVPTEGTPIRGWSMLSGAQQANLISLNILTVEDLATLPAEGMTRIGMGALEMRRRAEAWLVQNQSSESGALKLKDVQRENDVLKETVANLTEKVEALSRALDSKGKRSKDAE